jgi:hypothetical protein
VLSARARLDGSIFDGAPLFIVLPIALIAFAALGFATTFAPDWFTFAAWAALTAWAIRKRPAVVVAAFCVFEPLQGLLLSFLPPIVRYFDEAVMFGVSASILLPIFVRRPLALFGDRFVQLALAFVACGALAALLNDVPLKIALAGFYVTLDYVVMFIALRALELGRSESRAIVLVLFLVSIAATIAGAIQQTDPKLILFEAQLVIVEGAVARVPAVFEHPNDFGFFMLHGAVIAVAGALAAERKKLWIAFAIIAIVGVAVSVSRTSYLALFAALALAGLTRSRQMLKVFLPAGLVIGLLTSGFVVRGIEARIAKIKAEGGDARLTYAKQSIPAFFDYPLLGVGPGRFGGEVAHRYESPMHQRYGINFNQSWETIDSFWMHLLVESGAAGVFFFASILVLLAWRARRARTRAEDPYSRALIEALPMMVVAYLLIALTSMAFEANSTAGLFWTIAGVALSSGKDRIVV